MIRKANIVRSKAGVAICAFAFLNSAPLGADTSLETERICKPVMPQVFIKFVDESDPTAKIQLLVQYAEEGGEPYNDETFPLNRRISGCDVNARQCISSRMRYELRFEGLRDQSVQLRVNFINNEEVEGRILGGVEWYGPSYPDRVRATCDLSDLDPNTACTLDSVEYTPNPSTSGNDGGTPNIGRHDQCQPMEAESVTA